MMQRRRWFKAPEIAEYLGLAPKTIYSLCSKGILPHSKTSGVGLRIDLQKVDELIERHEFRSIIDQLERQPWR